MPIAHFQRQRGFKNIFPGREVNGRAMQQNTQNQCRQLCRVISVTNSSQESQLLLELAAGAQVGHFPLQVCNIEAVPWEKQEDKERFQVSLNPGEIEGLFWVSSRWLCLAGRGSWLGQVRPRTLSSALLGQKHLNHVTKWWLLFQTASSQYQDFREPKVITRSLLMRDGSESKGIG